MILLKNFLPESTARELEIAARDGPYKMTVTTFQPEPAALSSESISADIAELATSTLETAFLLHQNLIQPNRIKAISGPEFLRFLDGMSLGYAPVSALHGMNPARSAGMRSDAIIHVRLSSPDQYSGGDFQTASSDRGTERFSLARGDAVLFNWEDIFALRVVHKGPLLHLICKLQYVDRAGALDPLAPLAEAARSTDPDNAAQYSNLMDRVSSPYRSRNASPAPPSKGDTT